MNASSEFHFSPRPNRAHEIAWQSWGEAAFERAAREDKPILLSISAVWCHWCHVMDETSYSDPEVIATIGEAYVPVRVDTDRRPDVNARYNQGGWPTTAFLAPDGTLLAGATYLPAVQMRSALREIAAFYRENRERIAERAAQSTANERPYEAASPQSLQTALVERIRGQIDDAYDAQYGGFGTGAKFPMTDVLEFLLREYRTSGDEQALEMVSHTMRAMSGGDTYDPVEGGFFRYSTTRDWSVPHFEKMAEDHAGLVRVLAGLYRTGGDDAVRATLESTLRYLFTVLHDPQNRRFGGSQDADEAYYALPLEQRRARSAPYVDRTSYTNWTAALAGALLEAGSALADARTLDAATAVLDELHAQMLDEDGLVYHFIEPGGSPQVRGLLADQSALLRALVDAHEITGEPRFLQRARALAAAVERHFAAPDGGWYDRTHAQQALGALARRDRPLGENAAIAETFLRLSVLCEEPAYRERAQLALQLYAQSAERAGTFAAPYAFALRRYLTGETAIAIVGTPQESAALRQAALEAPDALRCIRTIAPGDAPELARRGFDPQLAAVAYVCTARSCGPPARTAEALRAALQRPGR